MAQIREVKLVDDLDGSPGDENITFGVDGKQYEIDLSEANVGKLRELLNPYIVAGRRASDGPGRRANTTTRPVVDREQNQAVREWARSQGLKISDRGRIPQEIMLRYQAAH